MILFTISPSSFFGVPALPATRLGESGFSAHLAGRWPPTSSPGLGHWGPVSPLPVWPAGGSEADGGADALWGPEGTCELLFFLVRQAERHPKNSTTRSSSGQAIDTDPAAPGYLGLPG